MKRRNNKKHDDHGPDESWLLPYSDLLTLLLALFIVLFAMSEVDVQKFEKLSQIFQTEFAQGGGMMDDSTSIVPEQVPVTEKDKKKEEDEKAKLEALEEYQKLKKIQEKINQYIGANSLQDTLATKLTAEGLLVTVRTDVTFNSGSAVVLPEGIEIAKEIATFLTTDPPHKIVVNGHADDVPVHNAEFASNWELSSMRAIEFMYLLLEDSKLEPAWFSARGFGEFQPIVENTTEVNRAMNRRVEVLIEPNFDIGNQVAGGSETDE